MFWRLLFLGHYKKCFDFFFFFIDGAKRVHFLIHLLLKNDLMIFQNSFFICQVFHFQFLKLMFSGTTMKICMEVYLLFIVELLYV